MFGRMTENMKVSELLNSLGGAESLEIRFSECDEPVKNSS